MWAAKVVPVLLLSALALAAVFNWARGKSNETFDGVIVNDNLRYEFYPDAKTCQVKGTSYFIVPDRSFSQVVQTQTNFQHFDRLFHGAWRVKLRGDLSRIGWFGYRGKNSRELIVRNVIDARSLDCFTDSRVQDQHH